MAVLPLLIFYLFFFLVSPPCLIHAQQPYVGKATTACGTTANNSNTVLGYTCNGLNTACQAYTTFRSRSPYNTVSSISQLLNSDPSRVSRINSVPDDLSIIDAGELGVVPVKCSCSGGHYYQSNTHYVVLQYDSDYSTANNKPWVFVVVGVFGGLGVLLVIGRIAFLAFTRGRLGAHTESCARSC